MYNVYGINSIIPYLFLFLKIFIFIKVHVCVWKSLHILHSHRSLYRPEEGV